MPRGFVHRRFLQRLRRTVPDLDHTHGVAETSPFGETLIVDERLGAHVRFRQVQIMVRESVRWSSYLILL
jgi:hypothetical protein